jgi:hypothetical protein
MTALDFPDSPTPGQQFTAPGGIVWEFQDPLWVLAGGGSGDDTRGFTFVQDTTPVATREGDTWLNDATGITTGVSHVAVDVAGTLTWKVIDTLPTFADTATRDAQWLNPPVGSFCVTLASTGILWYRGNTSSWRMIIKTLGSTVSVYAAYIRPYNMADVTYPKGYYLDITTSSCYLRWRPVIDVSTQVNVIAATSSSLELTNPGNAENSYKINNSYNNYTHSWVIKLPADANGLQYMYMQQDSARPTRVKLTVAGNVSADNLVGNLMERLEAAEAHIHAVEALLNLALPDRLVLSPPHSSTYTVPPERVVEPEDPPPPDE